MPHVDDIERLKLDLERERITTEAALRREELAIRERETKLKETEAGRAGKKYYSDLFKSPITLALIGLLGTGLGAALQGFWNTRLERQKFESEMIKLALQESTQDGKLNFLNFLRSTEIVTSLKLDERYLNDQVVARKLPNISSSPEALFFQNLNKSLCLVEPTEESRNIAIRDFLAGWGQPSSPGESLVNPRSRALLSEAIEAVPDCIARGYLSAYEVGRFGVPANQSAAKVAELQKRIRAALQTTGLDQRVLSITGVFDAQTRSAILALRTKMGIDPDFGARIDEKLLRKLAE
jgi:hypothetical protein